MEDITRLYTAEFLLRSFTAILFIGMGYDKLFHVKIPGVVRTFQLEAEGRNVPTFFLWLISIISSSLEFCFGLLLLVGFLRQLSLLLLGIDLLLIAVAFTYIKPVWDMRHVLFRLVFLLLLLLMPVRWARFSIDAIMLK